MAKELSRKYDIASRSVSVTVEDYFGHVSHHTIPLTADMCPHCGHKMPGNNGSPDVEKSIAAVLEHVRQVADDVIAKLEPISHPGIRQHVERAKAARGKK